MAFNYQTDFSRYKNYFLKIRAISEKPAAKLSIGLFLTLITICFFALFAIKPTVITISKLVKELQDGQQVNQVLERKITSLNQAQKNLVLMKNYLPLVDLTLPQKMDFNRFILELNYLILNHNLVLANFSCNNFNLTIPKEEQSILTFKIAVAGKFTDINQFLKDLTNLDRLVKISTLSFTNKSEVTDLPTQLNFAGEVYQLTNLN